MIESCDRIERTANLNNEKSPTPADLDSPLVEREVPAQIQRHDPAEALDLPDDCRNVANPDLESTPMWDCA